MSPPTRHPAGRGFTLVEVLVSVAIISIVTLAVAGMFATVGDTVTTGRAVSRLNRTAARVERVMRRDFEEMIRDRGFLVIRNELSRFGDTSLNANATPNAATNADLVALTPDDDAPRLRRIDEIMFFAEGDFRSKRRPLADGFVPESNTARIYYGHGWRHPEELTGLGTAGGATNNRYLRPRLEPDNVELNARAENGLGVPAPPGTDNPNEFASDWTLLRHVTLLEPRPTGAPLGPAGQLLPQFTGTDQQLPDELFGVPLPTGAARGDFADNTRQVAGQPATASAFRSLEALGSAVARGNVAEPQTHLRGLAADPEGADVAPAARSGLVDVATGGLAEIDAVVRSPFLSIVNNNVLLPTNLANFNGDGVQPTGTVLDHLARFVSGGFAFRTDNTGPTFPDARAAAHLWMLDAMPTEAFEGPRALSNDNFRLPGDRIRYEPGPTRAIGVEDPVVGNLADNVRFSYELADQEMLSSSIFLRSCTEFIVEFSFGITDRRPRLNSGAPNPNFGQPIWHGLRRWQENTVPDDNRYTPAQGDVLLADVLIPNSPIGTPPPEYDGLDLLDVNNATPGNFSIPRSLWNDNGTPDDPSDDRPEFDRDRDDFLRPDRIINTTVQQILGQQPVITGGEPPPNNHASANYLFGIGIYDDGATANPNDQTDDTVQAWPRPRLLRVIMRFVDPESPDAERTHEVIFRLPEPGAL